MPAGAKFIPRLDEPFTARVSTSVEVSNEAFSVFQASIDEEVSRDQIASSASGVNINLNVDCQNGQAGIIYWYPLYTIYRGEFTPSGNNVDFNIPDNSTVGASNFYVRCVD